MTEIRKEGAIDPEAVLKWIEVCQGNAWITRDGSPRQVLGTQEGASDLWQEKLSRQYREKGT